MKRYISRYYELFYLSKRQEHMRAYERVTAYEKEGVRKRERESAYVS